MRLRPGFTLIELLVVISIIAVLAGMLLPAVSLVRESSRMASCASRLRQVAMTTLLYADEHDGRLAPASVNAGFGPAAWGGGATNYFNWPLLGQYVPDTEDLTGNSLPSNSSIFHCPADPRVYPHINVSYGMNQRFAGAVVAAGPWTGSSLSSIRRGAEVVLLIDAAHWLFHPGYAAPPLCPGVASSAVIDGTALWGPWGGANTYFCWTNWHKQGENMGFTDGHVRSSLNPSGESLAGTSRFAILP